MSPRQFLWYLILLQIIVTISYSVTDSYYCILFCYRQLLLYLILLQTVVTISHYVTDSCYYISFCYRQLLLYLVMLQTVATVTHYAPPPPQTAVCNRISLQRCRER